MFTFERDGTSLKLQVEAKTYIAKRWYSFSWQCTDEIYADLLVKNFQEHLSNRLQGIRRSAYEEGWKDAKAKKKKETWFAGWL